MTISQKHRKIFCIGFNKTGTTSLHETFLSLGLTSTHNVKWTKISRLQPLNKSYFKTQCYTDGYRSNFVALDRNFPGSLFIYNDRNERSWLRSRVKHYLRFNKAPSAQEAITSDIFPWLAKDLFTDINLALRKWICEYRLYKKQALIYFHGRKNFMKINLTEDVDYTTKIFSFIDENNFCFQSQSGLTSFISNVRNDTALNKELTKPLFKIVDENLGEFEKT